MLVTKHNEQSESFEQSETLEQSESFKRSETLEEMGAKRPEILVFKICCVFSVRYIKRKGHYRGKVMPGNILEIIKSVEELYRIRQ